MSSDLQVVSDYESTSRCNRMRKWMEEDVQGSWSRARGLTRYEREARLYARVDERTTQAKF